MKTYMVWAFIEECDEENDEYQDVSTPKLLKAFDNETESRKYVNKLAAAPNLLDEHKDWSKLLGNIVIEALQGNYDCLKEVMTELPIIYIDGSPRIESNPIKKAGAE